MARKIMAFYKGKHKKQDEKQVDLFEIPTFGYREEVAEFIEKWNGHIWLPKITGTDRQVHIIKEAMFRPFFKQNWRDMFGMMVKSTWLRTKMRPRLRMEWILVPDNFDKLMEGFYLEDEPDTSIGEHKAIRIGDDEFIV